MPRTQTLSGEVVTVTETKGTDTTSRHWFLVYGTNQGITDFLNENNIPEHKVKHLSFVSSIWYCWYHK